VALNAGGKRSLPVTNCVCHSSTAVRRLSGSIRIPETLSRRHSYLSLGGLKFPRGGTEKPASVSLCLRESSYGDFGAAVLMPVYLRWGLLFKTISINQYTTDGIEATDIKQLSCQVKFRSLGSPWKG